MSLTSDPNDARLTHSPDTEPVDQAEAYLVLSEAERAQGFVRPVRTSYQHNRGRACGTVTYMATAIAETYARDPQFYGATYWALIAARDQAWRERIRATADELDRIGTDCRDKRPMSGRWVGRAVAYRASASKLRALGEGSTDA